MPRPSLHDDNPRPRYPGAINRRANGKFTAVSGYPERRSLGTFDTWREAEDALADAAFSGGGRAAFAAASTPLSHAPIDHYLELYIEERRKEVGEGRLERRSFRDIEHRLRYAIYDLGYRGHNDLRRLTPDEVALWVRNLYTVGTTYHKSKGPLSVQTARKVLSAFRQALDHAVEHEEIPSNPARLPKHLMPVVITDYGDGSDQATWSESVERWPTIQEWKLFERHLAGCPLKWGARQKALWALAAETGMRCGELAAVSKYQNGAISDIEWDQKVLNVRRSLGDDRGTIFAKTPKSRAGHRTIALFDTTIDALHSHIRQIELETVTAPRWAEPVSLSNSRGTDKTTVDLLFRNPDGTALNPTNVSQAFISEWKHAGLRKGVSLHGLRHLHASILLEGNPGTGIPPWSIERVAERLGDDPATVRSVYAHVLNRVDRARAGVEDIQRLYV